MFLSKNWRGRRLIAGAIGLFTKIIAKLEKGIALCDQQVTENTKVITDLARENGELAIESERGRAAISNLKALIGEKS